MDQRRQFVKELAQYLAGRQGEMSIRLALEAKQHSRPLLPGQSVSDPEQWRSLRSLTPLFGYPTVEEAEDKLLEWLSGGWVVGPKDGE